MQSWITCWNKTGAQNEAQRATCAGHRGEHFVSIVDAVGNVNVADALARQGQALRPGIAHDGVLIVVRSKRHIQVVDDLAVRLIGKQVDGMTVLSLLFLHKGGKGP